MNFMQFEWYRGYCISRLVSKDQYFGAGLIYCYPPGERRGFRQAKANVIL